MPKILYKYDFLHMFLFITKSRIYHFYWCCAFVSKPMYFTEYFLQFYHWN